LIRSGSVKSLKRTLFSKSSFIYPDDYVINFLSLSYFSTVSISIFLFSNFSSYSDSSGNSNLFDWLYLCSKARSSISISPSFPSCAALSNRSSTVYVFMRSLFIEDRGLPDRFDALSLPNSVPFPPAFNNELRCLRDI
jgi:hypothetical protein